MENKIEKHIQIKAPISRVWKALTDYREFGEWFCAKLDGPFIVGKESTGHISYPGYEHLKWNAIVRAMEPTIRFSFTWHPYAIDPTQDYSRETPTIVEFILEEGPIGTSLTVTESGFENIPEERRAEALQMNESGWAEQVKNIEKFITK